MEEDCTASQDPQRTVALEKKKKKNFPPQTTRTVQISVVGVDTTITPCRVLKFIVVKLLLYVLA
jgi:hypothetical protein